MAESVLDRIVESVRRRLAERPPPPGLPAAAAAAVERRRGEGLRSLRAALSGHGPAVIAECKMASPSAGVLRADFDPVALARAYEEAGAAAISVVTEPDFFRGDPDWLPRVRRAVGVPVLRKDFIVDPTQVLEAAALGADAILLIQRILDPKSLQDLMGVAGDHHLEVLLEVFADEDPAPAVASGCPLLGVNARDLATFRTRLDRVAAMAQSIPDDRVRVAESGIHGRDGLEELRRAGYDVFLVGEHLVRAADPGAALRELLR